MMDDYFALKLRILIEERLAVAVLVVDQEPGLADEVVVVIGEGLLRRSNHLNDFELEATHSSLPHCIEETF